MILAYLLYRLSHWDLNKTSVILMKKKKWLDLPQQNVSHSDEKKKKWLDFMSKILYIFSEIFLRMCSLSCVINSLRPSDAYNLTIIGPDNGLSPGRRQAIIWTNAGILLIGPWGTNFSEILIGIHAFHSRKFIWKCRLRNGGHFVSASMC